MKQWTRRAYTKPNFDDNHFFPQNWRCEFNSYLHSYKILRFDTFNPSPFIDDLLRILRKNNVSDKSRKFIRASLSSGRTSHSTHESAEQLQTRTAILSSNYLTNLLVKMYYYDFTIFGFQIPETIAA
ncbi:unnamed protein product [Cylicocyclus nassatus]|uniref:Uncharacterized protein n=1 Tax=Cylicocyclus nassatus TaxID=53992 RepID=A0AA36GPQ2_CYLNA|nr:unnamed protein product [Cylicocyclus nassatus]